MAVALMSGFLGALGGVAQAHNVLVSSDPADGATLDVVPSAVELVFDQPVQREFSTVAVLGPDGADWAELPADVVDGTVTVRLRPLELAGMYAVAYRVVSADGHPVAGELSFTIAATATGLGDPTATGPTTAATTSPAASPTSVVAPADETLEPGDPGDADDSDDSDDADDSDGAISGPSWLVIAAVVGAAVGLVLALRRARGDGTGRAAGSGSRPPD